MRHPPRAVLVALEFAVQHGVTNVRDELLELLRKTARVADVQAFQDALQQLQSSRIYEKHAALQNWSEKTWLPHKQVSDSSSTSRRRRPSLSLFTAIKRCYVYRIASYGYFGAQLAS